MKKALFVFVPVLAVSFVIAGCAKKEKEISLTDGTGFETATTQELAQLPQSTTGTSSNQQSAVEVLPIETSPVTQAPALASVPADTLNAAVSASASGALTQNQKIQTALKNAGLYSGKIDGKIGPGSKAAITAFQTQQGLKADGKVGPKTWAALEPYLTGSGTTATAATQE